MLPWASTDLCARKAGNGVEVGHVERNMLPRNKVPANQQLQLRHFGDDHRRALRIVLYK